MTMDHPEGKGTPRRVIVLVSTLIVVADQVTKALIMATVPLHARTPIIDGILDLTHVRNRGMAFGLFNGIEAAWLRWVLVAVAVIAVLIIWSYARHERHQLTVIAAFGAILGGAAGNLVDRTRFGYVIDFVLVHWRSHEWPAFNVADSAITIGGIALFLTLAWDPGNSHADEQPRQAIGEVPGQPGDTGSDSV